MSGDDNSHKSDAPAPIGRNQEQTQRPKSVQSLITEEGDTPLPEANRAVPDPSSIDVNPTTTVAPTDTTPSPAPLAAEQRDQANEEPASGTALTRAPQPLAAAQATRLPRPAHSSPVSRASCRVTDRPSRRGRLGVRRPFSGRSSLSVVEISPIEEKVEEEEEEEEEEKEEGKEKGKEEEKVEKGKGKEKEKADVEGDINKEKGEEGQGQGQGQGQ